MKVFASAKWHRKVRERTRAAMVAQKVQKTIPWLVLSFANKFIGRRGSIYAPNLLLARQGHKRDYSIPGVDSLKNWDFKESTPGIGIEGVASCDRC